MWVLFSSLPPNNFLGNIATFLIIYHLFRRRKWWYNIYNILRVQQGGTQMIKTMEMCEKDAAMKVADLMVSAAVSYNVMLLFCSIFLHL